MTNLSTRKQYAELLRHFVAGQLSNFEYENRADTILRQMGRDDATEAVRLEAWYLYDDLHEHYLAENHKVTKENRRIIARMILFLQTEVEYEWPYPLLRHELFRLLTVLTLGWLPWFQEPKYKDLGPMEVWPFFRIEDFEQAVRVPKLLAGLI